MFDDDEFQSSDSETNMTNEDQKLENNVSQIEEQKRNALKTFRHRFHREYGHTMNKFVPIDVRRLQRYDWWINMFLYRYDYDVDVAFPVFIECLKWRREFGVNEIGILQMKPFFEKQTMYIRGEDRLGRPILWFNVRNSRKDASAKDAHSMVTFWLEKHCFEMKGQPLVIVFDMYRTGLQNMDLDLIKFLLHCLKFYYPGLLAYLCVYDIPFILNAAWKVVKSWLDPVAQKKIIFVNKESILEYINTTHLPLHMEGTDEYEFSLEHLGTIKERLSAVNSSPKKEAVDLNGQDNTDSSGDAYESDSELMTADYLNRDFEYKMALEAKPEQLLKKRTVKFAEDCDTAKQNGVPPSLVANLSSANTNSTTTTPTVLNDSSTSPMPSSSVVVSSHQTTTASSIEEQPTTPVISPRAGPPELSAEERKQQQQKMKQLTHKTKEWMDFRVNNMQSSFYEGPFLVVSPKEELSFQAIPGEQDRVEVIVLKNTGQRSVIFKIKTTSPEKFRVRPSSGLVSSTEKVVIRIYLQAGYQDTVGKEKFLVTAIQVEEPVERLSPERIGELWKNSQKETIFEYKLTCRVSASPSRIISPQNMNTKTGTSNMENYSNDNQNEDLTERIGRLRLENRVIMALLVTVFCLMFVLLFYQRSIYRSLSSRLDTLVHCHKQSSLT